MNEADRVLSNRDPRVREWFRDLQETARDPRALHGEVCVVPNGMFQTPFDCGYRSPRLTGAALRGSGGFAGVLAPIIVPEAWSFQHFVDGLLPKLAQAEHILRRLKATLVLESIRDPIVGDILDRLGFRYRFYSGPVRAHTLVSACRAPPLHPQLWMRAAKMLGVPSMPGTSVVWLRRTPATSANGGRMITNQDSVIKELRKHFNVVVFTKYEGLEHTMRTFGSARVIIGSHGGALTNVLFAPKGTTVIEYMPLDHSGTNYLRHAGMMMYHQSAMLGHHYWRIPVVSASSNYLVDAKALVQLVRFITKGAKRAHHEI